jgi:hypothetical protein
MWGNLNKQTDQSKNAERLVRKLDELGCDPAPARKSELVLAAVALLLAWVYFDKDAAADLRVLTAAKPACEVERERAARYATALVHALNQRPFVVDGQTVVSCRVRHS